MPPSEGGDGMCALRTRHTREASLQCSALSREFGAEGREGVRKGTSCVRPFGQVISL